MKVEHITFSGSGGAGLVASNLVQHQRKLGADARLNTVIDSNLYQEPLRFPLLTAAAVLDKYGVSNRPNGTLFSHFRNGISLFDLNKLSVNSVVHLHWLSGVLGIDELRTLLASSRKVTWTLHDMAPFTGGCHHANDCVGYESNCDDCPQARSVFRARVSIQKKKELMPENFPNLTLVTPTFWMERKVQASSRFRNTRVVTIPNPISEDYLNDFQKDHARYKLGLSAGAVVFMLIASNLNDPAKNVKAAVENFKSITNKAGQDKAVLVLVGSAGEKFENSQLGIRWIGQLNPSKLAEAAAAADWVLSCSVAESAGMTIAECASLGVPALVMDAGGVSEMLIPSESGLIAETNQEFRSFLESAINKSLNQSKMSDAAREFARERFNPKTIAQKYLDLYES